MNLDPATVIAGLPIKTVRDAIREMNRRDLNDYGWSVDNLAAHMKISATHAEWLCERLREQGALERKPQPDTRWHERGRYYAVSDSGTRFINATMLKRINQAKVKKLIADLLERVKQINADGNLCLFINEVRLFGSALNDQAETFGDVDICYVAARRKTPPGQKSWTDWSRSRARLSGRRNMAFIDELNYGDKEVLRILEHRSPYISLHNLDDVVGIGAESVRLFIAPEGAIQVEGGGASGEALSQVVMKAAIQSAEEKLKKKTEKELIDASIDEGQPKERMISAIKSLAFDLLCALDGTTPPDVLEHSIEVAHERIKAYRMSNLIEPIAGVLHDTLAIDVIEQNKIVGKETFVFSGDRERWARDGTIEKAAAMKGMKHAVIAELKYALAGHTDPDRMDGMARQFEAYQRAEYSSWKYRQEHGYDWYGPEYLSKRAVDSLRNIASGTGDKLNKQALKTLSYHGFIKLYRKKKWRLTNKGEHAIRYHDEREEWNQQNPGKITCPK